MPCTTHTDRPFAHITGESEVGDARLASRIEEHIAILQVAVHKARAVERLKAEHHRCDVELQGGPVECARILQVEVDLRGRSGSGRVSAGGAAACAKLVLAAAAQG